jgi:peroxiredoxin
MAMQKRSASSTRMLRTIYVALLALSLGPAAIGTSAEPAPPIGKPVGTLELTDVHGKPHALDEHREQVVVLVFLGVECPLAAKYAPRLCELAEEFKDQGVAFLGVDSNLQDSLSEIAAFARRHSLTFPIYKDNHNQVADRTGATRTPEVVLLDRQRTLRYRGRIDDQFGFQTAVGYVRPKLTDRSLAAALADVLAGRQVRRPELPAAGCLIGRVSRQTPGGQVTYAKHIARIMQNRCVECHRPGEAAPFTLLSYEDVRGWAEMIREVVQEGRMPPWFADPRYGHFKNDARLSESEKQQLFAWVDNGCPEGDPADLPEPRKFVEGWRIGEPDEILYVSEEPFRVPAEGVLEYQYFTIDPGWKTDKWIQAAEIRPGNRAVVHHLRVDLKAANAADAFPRDFIAQYGPGFLPNVCPPGTAVHVPAHSKLVIEVHYTPNGSPQTDRSMIGLRFADLHTVKKMLIHGCAYVDKEKFRIPPGDRNCEIQGHDYFDSDTLLVSLLPHMHLRGKSFRYEAEYPDGNREVLLSVPRYDFNWQLEYFFSEPKLLPKGTKLHCIAHYDNSADNPANPDPSRVVRYDKQIFDEMLEGTFTCIPRDEDAACLALVALSLTQQALERATRPPVPKTPDRKSAAPDGSSARPPAR